MPRRLTHRLALVRASHRGDRRSACRRPRAPRHALTPRHKRSLKHATIRDCGRRCVYCAVPLCHESATLDHVQPVSRGGMHDPGNLVAACGPCNRMKGDMLPVEFFARYPWAGANFIRYARTVHRALKRNARRAVSLALAA